MNTDPITDAICMLLILDVVLAVLLGLGVIAYLFPVACRWMTDRLERMAGITNHAE